jgi:hypothetical protein
MNKANLVLPIFVVLLVFSLLPIVSAEGAASLSSPKAYGNYSGTLNFTCLSGMEDALNASILYNVSGGAATTYLATVVNTSANQSVFKNAVVSVAALASGITYNATCLMSNATDSVYSTTSVAGITVDNTAPTCTISVPVSNVPNQGSQTVTWSVTDDLSLVSNNQNITGPTGFTMLTSTSAVSSTTFSLNNKVGSWKSNVLGTDRAGNSCLGTVSFTSYNNAYGEGYNGATTTPTGTTNTKTVLLVLGALAVIYFIFKKKK